MRFLPARHANRNRCAIVRAAVLALGFTLAPYAACAGAAASIHFDLRDTEGRRHTSAEMLAAKAAVLVFVAPDCPISNRYTPALQQLYATYSPRGVLFYAVYSDPAVTAEQAASHAREFRYPFPALLDSAQMLARAAGATATPEAAVLSPPGALLYRGRLDNRIADFGREKPQPTREDLRIALDEILAGRPVAVPRTRAAGCGIPFLPENSSAAGAGAGHLTFARDIAPILYQNCASCHHDGGSGPFALMSYSDTARRASQIAAVTASGYMPPWKPQPGYGRFQNERGLTAAEISAIREWAEGGAPSGDASQTPLPPQFQTGWQLGRPDLIVQMPQPFAVPAGGRDLYQCFVVPLGLTAGKYVKAVEFQPQSRRVVHHAIFFSDASGAARRRAAGDAAASYPCFGAPGFLPVNSIGGWSPGSRPVTFPEGVARFVERGSDLVLQLHFHPTGKPETEQAAVGIYFAASPPTKHLLDIPLGSNQIDIPAGAANYKVRDSFTLPADVYAIGIIPHAHFICRDMKGFAALPGGARQWLLWIKDWDFNWQEQYRFAAPVRLPAGTRLEMEFTYDNSAANPRNPSRPPKRVLYGPDSTDEMAGLHIEILPVRNEDLEELGQALWGKMMRTAGGKFFTLEK